MFSQPAAAGLPRDFKAAFCECFGCPPEAFEKALFRKCLAPALRPVASLVRLLSPAFFREDLRYLARVGKTNSWREFWTLATHIRRDPGLSHGLLRKALHLRISGARLISTYQQITARRLKSLA